MARNFARYTRVWECDSECHVVVLYGTGNRSGTLFRANEFHTLLSALACGVSGSGFGTRWIRWGKTHGARIDQLVLVAVSHGSAQQNHVRNRSNGTTAEYYRPVAVLSVIRTQYATFIG